MLLLLLACDPTTVVEGDTADDSAADTADSADTGEAPRDLDDDGYPAGEDCMDLNAAVHPGATEIWNGLDDDCDGVFDADGDWSGALAGEATAIYEGRPYRFDFDCELVGTRATGSFPWTVTCLPDPRDDDAMLMLGDVLTATPADPAVEGDSWTGEVVVASSNGWDTDASGVITWSALDAATISFSLDAASLALGVSGALARE